MTAKKKTLNKQPKIAFRHGDVTLNAEKTNSDRFPEKWHEVADVVVIGSGFAGLAAAIEAGNAGASVIILEKMKGRGGNSVISDGLVAAAGSALQIKKGITDSPQIMFEDMLKAGLGLNHPALVKLVVEKSAETLQWTTDYLGVQNSGQKIDKCLKRGVVKNFDDLANLAANYGIPKKPLKETIEEYNEYVLQKQDKAFGKPILERALPIIQAPFYGIRLWPKVHHTMGGIRINADAQVMNLDGHPIEGLYAAGEVTGGVHGACRLGSCAIIDCLVFGRMAGKNAAAQLKG